MKHFMSNPCGYGHCMEWQCEKCSHFKPRFFGIPVPRWLGWLLYEFEEYLWFKSYKKTHPDNNSNKNDF